MIEPSFLINYHNLLLAEDFKVHVSCSANISTAFRLNVRSIRNKIGYVMLLVDEHDFMFDKIMFSETWLQNKDNPMVIPGYVHYFANQPDKRGGVFLCTSATNFDAKC